MDKTIEINGVKIYPKKYIDKWTAWALEATPATDEQVISNVQRLYEKANLKKPVVHVYRDYEKFMKIDCTSVMASVVASVRDSVRVSVWNYVWDYVWNYVRASVRASVGDSVRDSVGDSVRDSVRVSVMASVGAWYWADDLSFADVFVDANVLTKEKAQELEEYKKLLETQRIAVLTEDVAYVLVAPTIRRNDDGQLHSDQRPAVEWENETGLYYLDGVNLPKDLWKKIISKEMTFSEIMKIEIADQRTVALKYNPEAIIKEQAKLVHKDDRNNELYLIENQEINRITNYPKMYFIKMLCPTGRIFVEGVDPEDVKELGEDATALQAKALGLVKSEYSNLLLES